MNDTVKTFFEDISETLYGIKDLYNEELNEDTKLFVYLQEEGEKGEFGFIDFENGYTFYPAERTEDEIIFNKENKRQLNQSNAENTKDDNKIFVTVFEKVNVSDIEDGIEYKKFIQSQYKEGQYAKFTINSKNDDENENDSKKYYLVNNIDIKHIGQKDLFFSSGQNISANQKEGYVPYLREFALECTPKLIGIRETEKSSEGKKNINCEIDDIVEINSNNQSDEELAIALYFAYNNDEVSDVSKNMQNYLSSKEKNDNGFASEIEEKYSKGEISKFEDFFESSNEREKTKDKYRKLYVDLRKLYGIEKNTENTESIFYKELTFNKDEAGKEKEDVLNEIKDIQNNYYAISQYGHDHFKNEPYTVSNLHKWYKNFKESPTGRSIDPNEVRKTTDASIFEGMSDLEKDNYSIKRAAHNLKVGRKNFERDLLTGKIETGIVSKQTISNFYHDFIKDNEIEIITDIIDDETIPEISLSNQLKSLKDFNKNLKRNYDFDEKTRKSILYNAYMELKPNTILRDNEEFIDNYIKKQLYPRELKLEKVLSLHTVNQKNEIETVFETETKALIKEFNKNTGKTDIYVEYKKLGEKEFLGTIDNSDINIEIVEDVELLFGNNEDFKEKIDSYYNKYIQINTQKIESVKNIQEEYKKNAEEILKNSAIVLYDFDKKGNISEVTSFYIEDTADNKLVCQTIGANWVAKETKYPEEGISSVLDYINNHKNVIPMTIDKDKANIIEELKKVEENLDNLTFDDIKLSFEEKAEKAKKINLPHQSTFKETKNELKEALEKGKYIVIADYSDKLVNNNSVKILKINDVGEAVCLDISKKGPYLLAAINDEDFDKKFNFESKILNGQELNDILSHASSKNISSKILPDNAISKLSKDWKVDLNTLDKNKSKDFIEGIRDITNSSIGFKNDSIKDILSKSKNGENKEIFISYENGEGNIKNSLRLIEEGEGKYSLDVIKKVNDQEFITKNIKVVLDEKENKFVINKDFYLDKESNKPKIDVEMIKAFKAKIEEINTELKMSSNQLSINSNRGDFLDEKKENEDGTNTIISLQESLNCVFDLKNCYNFIDNYEFKKILNQATSDSKNEDYKLQKLFEEGKLGTILKADLKVFEKINENSTDYEIKYKDIIEKLSEHQDGDVFEFLDNPDLEKFQERIYNHLYVIENKMSLQELAKNIQTNINKKELENTNETVNENTQEPEQIKESEIKESVQIPELLFKDEQEIYRALYIMANFADDKDFEDFKKDTNQHPTLEFINEKELDKIREKIFPKDKAPRLYDAIDKNKIWKEIEEALGGDKLKNYTENDTSKADSVYVESKTYKNFQKSYESYDDKIESLTNKFKIGKYTFQIKPVKEKEKSKCLTVADIKIQDELNKFINEKNSELFDKYIEVGLNVTTAQKERSLAISNKVMKDERILNIIDSYYDSYDSDNPITEEEYTENIIEAIKEVNKEAIDFFKEDVFEKGEKVIGTGTRENVAIAILTNKIEKSIENNENIHLNENETRMIDKDFEKELKRKEIGNLNELSAEDKKIVIENLEANASGLKKVLCEKLIKCIEKDFSNENSVENENKKEDDNGLDLND